MYKVSLANSQVRLYLRCIETVLKLCKILKYYEQVCRCFSFSTFIFLVAQRNRLCGRTNLHCLKSVNIRSYSVPYFPAFGLNIQSECGKYGPEKLWIWIFSRSANFALDARLFHPTTSHSMLFSQASENF